MTLATQGIAASLTGFLKTTIAGGLLFLLPMVLIVIVLGHAMRLAGRVAQPISELVPLDALGGVGGVTVVAVLVLIFVSFVAGLLARTSGGKRIMRWFENSLLGGLPQYQLVKSMAEGLAHVESAHRGRLADRIPARAA